MSRNIHSNPVEKLVDAYLKRFDKTSKLGRSKHVIEKAAKLIGIALHDPCCQPAEEVILGRTEDFFLIQLTSMLNGIDVRKWRESLERAKAKLEKVLYKLCCVAENPVAFVLNDNTTGFYKIQVLSEDGLTVLDETESNGVNGTQTLNVEVGTQGRIRIVMMNREIAYPGVESSIELHITPPANLIDTLTVTPPDNSGTSTTGVITLVASYTILTSGGS